MKKEKKSVFIGLDLGGTNLKYAAGNGEGEIFIKKKRPSLAKQSRESIFANIVDAVNELKEKFETIDGIGLGTPGCINFEKGELIGTVANLPALTDAPVRAILEAELNTTVWVDNDANIMTLAEARVGAATGFTNVVCITIGTGIGGGLILNNLIYRGSTFTAAEIGHTVVQVDGRACGCGHYGCLEAYTSAPAIVERYRDKLENAGLLNKDMQISTELIFEQANANEKYALQTVQETCDYLGIGIGNVVNIINPQIVVIGGGVAEAGDDFIRQIETAIRQHAIKANTKELKVVNALLGNDAGVIGAILLAAESCNPGDNKS